VEVHEPQLGEVRARLLPARRLPAGARGVDLERLLQRLCQQLHDVGVALVVEVEQRATDVHLAVVEPVGLGGRLGVAPDLLERLPHEPPPQRERQLGERHVVEQRPRRRPVEVLDRPAHLAARDQFDALGLPQDAHVVRDQIERFAQGL
jgi:hypothetical protein